MRTEQEIQERLQLLKDQLKKGFEFDSEGIDEHITDQLIRELEWVLSSPS